VFGIRSQACVAKWLKINAKWRLLGGKVYRQLVASSDNIQVMLVAVVIGEVREICRRPAFREAVTLNRRPAFFCYIRSNSTSFLKERRAAYKAKGM